MYTAQNLSAQFRYQLHDAYRLIQAKCKVNTVCTEERLKYFVLNKADALFCSVQRNGISQTGVQRYWSDASRLRRSLGHQQKCLRRIGLPSGNVPRVFAQPKLQDLLGEAEKKWRNCKFYICKVLYSTPLLNLERWGRCTKRVVASNYIHNEELGNLLCVKCLSSACAERHHESGSQSRDYDVSSSEGVGAGKGFNGNPPQASKLHRYS